MTKTTFSEFADATRGNYCTLPKLDVEILPDVRHCRECGEVVRWERESGRYGMGDWVHAEAQAEEHYVAPRTRCVYCHNDDPGTVRFHQRAWSDETECDRCGGVQGYAIGD